MWKKDHKKVAGMFGMLLSIFTLNAQYTVTGGKDSPLLALDDTPNRLQIYLVHGAEDVAIRYTSASSSNHRWYRYKTKALETEAVNALQEGLSSILGEVEDGYGYFVEEPGALPRYIWIVDYSKHAFNIQNLKVAGNDNPCAELWLEGTAEIPPLTYYTPNGLSRELPRSFEVVFNTLRYVEESKRFLPETITQTITGNPFNTPLAAPLCDTEVTLKGDLFARHFSIESTAATDTYQAVTVNVRLDTTSMSFASGNLSGNGSGMSAPMDIRFEAIANEPVTSFYKWTITRRKDERTETVLSFTGRSVDYTFRDEGVFVAILEAGDRTGRCSQTDSVTIEIGSPYLSAPNTFSPGASPGVNDEFKVTYKSLVNFKGWIFNRWGVEMFHWTDPSKGWDGKKGGKYVPPGVYFYVIEAKGADGKNHSLKGHINIIRSKNEQDNRTE
ncbi:MAG: gliding motility-associated C-terminal domain-containing protein [Tannerellaceae bacterium]|jgi:gliding motility-associated-like protein|nr:gliding motility-associated C-terminal domain-containing protein [Tannerellaceae bacterium]